MYSIVGQCDVTCDPRRDKVCVIVSEALNDLVTL